MEFDGECTNYSQNIIDIVNRNSDENIVEECRGLFSHLPYRHWDLEFDLDFSTINRAALEDKRHTLRANVRSLNTRLYHRNVTLTDELEDQALEHKREIRILKENFEKQILKLELQTTAVQSECKLSVKLLKEQLELEKAAYKKEIEELNRAINFSLVCDANHKDILYGVKIPFRRVVDKLQHRVRDLDRENKQLKRERVKLLSEKNKLLVFVLENSFSFPFYKCRSDI